MSKLIFTDGMSFDIGNELRTEERSDGWYVLGKGLLIPVVSQEEGNTFIQNINNVPRYN